MISKPTVAKAFQGVLSEIVENRIQRNTLIIESGILGGDMIPRAFMDSTVKHLRNDMEVIAIETEDEVDIRLVGSSKFGAENRAVFGDLDCIMRMEKPETLSRIKDWVMTNHFNVRDIESRAHGKDLNPKKLGNKFSFLYPIHRPDGETLTIGELRAILQARHGSTNWKDHHDERLKVGANLDNIKDKSGDAMVQVDIMKVIVDGEEISNLTRRAQRLADRLESMDIDNKDELKVWLQKSIDKADIADWELHYEFLRNHGEMQNNDDQQILAAVYFLKNQDRHKGRLNDSYSNTEYRYSFHPDSLQIIYFLAKQVGIPLSDDNFSKKTLETIIQRAIQAGIVSDKLMIGMLRDPNEAFSTFKGKFKEEAKKHILSNTKNKRSDEHNPGALWKNLGTREIKRV